MVKISIDAVTPGMIAQNAVHDPHGVLLAPRDVPLGETHIRAMRAYGVRTVDIVSDEPEPDPSEALFEATQARCRALLRPRFAGLDLATPFGRTVFDEAVRRTAHRVMTDGIDLRTVQPAFSLLGQPPEKQLFCATPIDPASLVSGDVELATLPEVYSRLLETLQSEKTSAQELSHHIGADPGLTAKLLRLANSPHYGAKVPVDSVSRAISMVGRKELTNLVMGLAAVSAFGDINPELWDMRAFWRHAAACGVYAALLAEGCPGTDADRAFLGGLLHDIGQLVVLRKLPAAAGRALLLSRTEGLPLDAAEQAVLGFDHTAVGRALLTNWHFPQALTDMTADHLHPDRQPDFREAAVIHVADILATAWSWPAFSAAPVPPLSEAAWQSLDMPETTLLTVASAGDARIREIESIFFPTSSPACP